MTSCQQAKRSYGLESGGVAAWTRGSRQPGTPPSSLPAAGRRGHPSAPAPARVYTGVSEKYFPVFCGRFFKGETR